MCWWQQFSRGGGKNFCKPTLPHLGMLRNVGFTSSVILTLLCGSSHLACWRSGTKFANRWISISSKIPSECDTRFPHLFISVVFWFFVPEHRGGLHWVFFHIHRLMGVLDPSDEIPICLDGAPRIDTINFQQVKKRNEYKVRQFSTAISF